MNFRKDRQTDGRCRSVVAILIALAAGASLVGCGNQPSVPADAVAVFDGGWVGADELAAASSGAGAGALKMLAGRNASPDELSRWIAWQKLVADDRRPEVIGRRDLVLLAREIEQRPLVDRLLEEISAGIEVTDQEIESEIATVRAERQANEPRLTVRHIFLRASDDMSAEDRQRKLALARRLLGELRAGASFEELARQYSESSTAANGGLIPGLRPGKTDPVFERVVFALDEGEISDVITTASGYHIVRLDERSGPSPLDEQTLRKTLPELIRSRNAEQARAELIARLKQSEPYDARWNDDGVIEPRARDGAILVVGDLVYTAQDLKEARAQAGVALQRPDQIRAFLDGLLERELLAGEAKRHFELSRDQLAAQHEQAVWEALVTLAVRDEEEAIKAAIPRSELERFAAEHPQQLEAPAAYRPEVIFVPDGANVWETFRETEVLVQELRGGADFATAARERSAGPNADLGGDLGFLSAAQLTAYDLEIVQLIGDLEVGQIAGPVHIADNKLSTGVGSMRGGFLIVKLLDRRESRRLDLTNDEAEIRRRYWSVHRADLLRQARDERLTAASFQLRREAADSGGAPD